MNSCILPYVKSSECALEQGQASLGKHSVWAVLLPGCKHSPAIAKLGNVSFSQLLKILSLAPHWPEIQDQGIQIQSQKLQEFFMFLWQTLPVLYNPPETHSTPRVTQIPAHPWPGDTSDTQLPSAMILFLWSMTYRLCFSFTSSICCQLVLPCVHSPHLCRLWVISTYVE